MICIYSYYEINFIILEYIVYDKVKKVFIFDSLKKGIMKVFLSV